VQWPVFSGLPEEDVRRVLSVSRRRRFARREVVFHRGDPADTVHLIAKGRFAVRVVTPLGDTVILTVLGPGELFGELALLTGTERSATVVAVEAGETLGVHRIDFDRLRRDHPETTEVMVAVLGAQVRRLSDALVEALFVPADRRVLRRVHDLAAMYEGDRETVDVPLTQEDVAAMAGTSRATVNRVLRDAEQRGVVRLQRGRTVVLDREALARLAGR
jgi:CRP/FNR family cyclic AMP-dependent transcriptional regulator